MTRTQPRNYHRNNVVAFRKTQEAFGGLSNMAPGFPIHLQGRRIHTAEALYQACRFPHLPDVQAMILNQTSPMTAKMRSKPYREQTRPDWDHVRVPIMKWCLRVKLAQNWTAFATLLLETEDLPIVEDSHKDDFWGAKPETPDLLRGCNVLGRLLMELREKVKTDPAALHQVKPVPIEAFLLLSEPIGVVEATAALGPLDPAQHCHPELSSLLYAR